jgi:uncharacterized cupredoxin-like copper-binding protein
MEIDVEPGESGRLHVTLTNPEVVGADLLAPGMTMVVGRLGE